MSLQKLSFLFLIVAVIGFTSCNDDDDDNQLTGTARIEVTDSPIDDASVEGAFVTISEVRVNGEQLEGFNKTTIDLLAYQNGETDLLEMAELETGAYSNITLVLDHETDENGDAPGCYVEDDNGQKHALISSAQEIHLNHDFDIEQDQRTDLVIDFDLRKCITRDDSGSDDYEFATESEMESGIRVVHRDNAGVIEGDCMDAISQSDKVIVYAYKKGEYDRDTELNGQGQSNIRFSNAVTSSEADGSGTYELHFLEEGEYELQYVSYRDQDSDGEYELQGTLDVDVLSSIDINSVNVDAATTTTVNVEVTGLIPL